MIRCTTYDLLHVVNRMKRSGVRENGLAAQGWARHDRRVALELRDGRPGPA